jgi:hypothetical protein
MAENEPTCWSCQVKTSLIWRRTEEGNVICLDCYTAQKKNEKQPSNDVTGGTPPPPPPTPSSSSTTVTTRRRKGGRKGGRGGIDKSSSTASTSQPVQQKGRRSLIKGKPIKAPVSEPHLSTSDSVIYKVSSVVRRSKMESFSGCLIQ